MNNLIRTFLDRLHDRIIASVGSMIGSTFTVFRAAHHTEQKSFLEDLARKYESEGKLDLAEQIRSQSDNLSTDDPATEALPVFRNVLADQNELPLLCDNPCREQVTDESKTAATPPRKKRRGRRPSMPADDMGVSLD